MSDPPTDVQEGTSLKRIRLLVCAGLSLPSFSGTEAFMYAWYMFVTTHLSWSTLHTGEGKKVQAGCRKRCHVVDGCTSPF